MPLYNTDSLKEQKKVHVFSHQRVMGFLLLAVIITVCFAIYTPYLPLLKTLFIGVFGIFGYVLPICLIIIDFFMIKDKDMSDYIVAGIFMGVSLYALLCIFDIAFSRFNNIIDGTDYLSYVQTIFQSQKNILGTVSAVTIYPLIRYTNIFSAFVIYAIIFIVTIGVAIKLSFGTNYKKIKNGIRVDDLIINQSGFQGNSLNEVIARKKAEKDYREPVYQPQITAKPIFEDVNADLVDSLKDAQMKETYAMESMDKRIRKIARFQSDYSDENDASSVFLRELKNIDENQSSKAEEHKKMVEEADLSALFGAKKVEEKKEPEEEYFNFTPDEPEEKVYEKQSPSYVSEGYEEKIFTKPKPKMEKQDEKINKPTNAKAPKSDGTIRPYTPPPLSLLTDIVDINQEPNEYYQNLGVKIKELYSSFGIDVTVRSVTVGPRVTRFELEVQKGVKYDILRQYANNLKGTLQCEGELYIQTPLPGRDTVGIDVPNKKVSVISYKSMIDTYQFMQDENKDLFVVGKTMMGENKYARLKDMPHMLVAGSTGSGKSVFLNSLLISLIYHSTPDDLRFIIVDPKFVEFPEYTGVPHMLVENTINEVADAVRVLKYAVDEMNRRYMMLKKYGCKQFDEYIALPQYKDGTYDRMFRLLIVIDELGDLMQTEYKRELEQYITILTQKARAAGIYLILATQRPTTQVISGNIKTNLPSRVSFKLSSGTDSRVILDDIGAEKLLGKGDMLIKLASMSDTERLQGPFLSGKDIKAITDFVRENNDTNFDLDAEEKIFKTQSASDDDNTTEIKEDIGKDEKLVANAIKICIVTGYMTASKLQRDLSVGYNKASKLAEYLVKQGYVADIAVNNKRTTLITEEEYNERFGDKYGRL